MILKNLSLTNYRGFEQLEIDFHEKVNVIAGINGVGKSSVLHALRVLFSRLLKDVAFDKMVKASFTEDDVQSDQSSLNVGCEIKIDNITFRAAIQRSSSSQKWREIWMKELEKVTTDALLFKQRKDKPALSNANGKIRGYKALLTSREDQYALQWEIMEFEFGLGLLNRPLQVSVSDLRAKPDLPFAVYYSPLRHIFKRVTKPLESIPFGIDQAFENALQETEIDLRHFMHWFKFLEQSDNPDTKEKREFLLTALRKSVETFIREFSNLRLEETPKPRLIVDKNGVALELGQLSDGERGLLVLVFDLTRRLALANPSSSNPIAEGKAIVLIDELELHLHPSWQRDALRRLTATFQNCQFIITTHSPQIIGEVPAECIRFLTRDETGKVIQWIPPQALGLDSNRVLEELMGAPSRNAAIDAELQELFRKVDAEDFVAAREMIAKIQKTLGIEDPEITRAEALISFLEESE